MPQRPEPRDLSAEQAVLYSMLSRGNAVTEALASLNYSDFSPRYQEIFTAIKNISDRGDYADIVSVTEELRQEGKLDYVGGMNTISSIATALTTITAANLDYYIKIVRDKSILRKLIQAADQIATSAYNANQDVSDILNEAERTILGITLANTTSQNEFEGLHDILLRAFDTVSKLSAKGGSSGLLSGFRDLDRCTGGFQNSDFILVAARPSMGKTSFVLNIATYAGKRGSTIGFFSLEMSKEQLILRMLCAEGGIDAQRLHTGAMNDEEWNSFVTTANELSKTKIYIDDTAGLTVTEISSRARRLRAQHGLDLIIIDYLQLMQGRMLHKDDNRQQEVSDISRSLKALARELHIPIIALSQLSRAVETRQIKRPMLSDLRESGSLEQDADIVMFLYREDYYDKDSENKNIAEVIIAKHRNGPTGSVNLQFQKEMTCFHDLASPSYMTSNYQNRLDKNLS